MPLADIKPFQIMPTHWRAAQDQADHGFPCNVNVLESTEYMYLLVRKDYPSFTCIFNGELLRLDSISMREMHEFVGV